jgi:cytochrome c-type biogenesis protein CcmE
VNTPPRGRGRRVLLGVALVGLLLLGIGATLQRTLIYYRTPSEVANHVGPQHTRLAGAVVPGSLHRLTNGVLAFDVTDGRRTVHVVSTDTPPRMFQPGRQAVLDGALSADGVFLADRVLAKHGTVYRPPNR